MRLIISALVFAILIASTASAAGLKITEIDYHIDYDEAYTYRVERRDRIDSGSVSPTNNSKIDADLFPGSNITFTVRVENTFPSGGPTIKGVFASMIIEEIDDGADLEDESLDFDLEPGDDYRYDLEFTMPLDVDSVSYNVVLEAEGEDKNNTLHQTLLILKMGVKKQSHDIRIIRTLLNPEVVSCDRKAKLTAEIMNLGSNIENQNALEFKSDILGINSIDKDIALESSDEASEEEKVYTKSLNFEVPNSLKTGAYPLFVNLYWKNFVLFDQKELELIVKDCNGVPPQPENDEKDISTEPRGTVKTEGDAQGYSSVQKLSILISPALILALAGGLAIVIIIAVLAFKAKSARLQVNS